MKRSSAFLEPVESGKIPALECGICFEPLKDCPTRMRCCRQPIDDACRRRCGIVCPFCRHIPSKEFLLAEILIGIETGTPVYAKTERLFEKLRHHRALITDPMHACIACQRFSRLQLILTDRLSRNPTNRADIQNALDRLATVMPIP